MFSKVYRTQKLFKGGSGVRRQISNSLRYVTGLHSPLLGGSVILSFRLRLSVCVCVSACLPVSSHEQKKNASSFSSPDRIGSILAWWWAIWVSTKRLSLIFDLGYIGRGAQSSLGGKTFLAEKCLKNYQNFRILHDFCPKNARILHNNWSKIIFTEFGGRGACPRLLRLCSWFTLIPQNSS